MNGAFQTSENVLDGMWPKSGFVVGTLAFAKYLEPGDRVTPDALILLIYYIYIVYI
jgi:hypothetical protein